jgi:hypothetical protein
VVVASIVEAWFETKTKWDHASDAHDTADYFLSWALKGHEVVDLAYTVRTQEPSDQNIGVREIQLFGFRVGVSRRDAIEAACAAVENGCEDARAVETVWAVPVDGAVSADERHASLVADDAVFSDREVLG